MTPRLIIFDCDGVLVETETITNTIIANSLSRHGLSIAPAECQALFSGGTLPSAAEEAQKRGAKLPTGWIDAIYTEIFDALAEGAPVIDGLFEVLDALDAAKIATAIASNGPPRKMELSLGPSGLHARFKGRIYSRVTHGPPKPDPAMLLHACRDAGVAPREAVMIDDSPVGLLAAERAGVRPIGFDAPNVKSRLKGSKHTVISDMRALLPLLGLA